MKEHVTANLKYRPFQEQDKRFLVELLTEDAVCRYLPGNIGYPESKIGNVLYRFMNSYKEDKYYQVFLVADKTTNQPIGYCGIQPVAEFKKYEIFYAYIPSAWGKGYGTEASIAMRDLAKEIGLKELIALADIENLGSQKVLEKTGFIKQKKLHLWGLDMYFYEMKLA